MAETNPARPRKRQKSLMPGPDTNAVTPPAVRESDFSLKKALFEIAIVAVGVFLALIVDEARQSRADRVLADEARTAMRTEIEQNRVRLSTKLALLHKAHQALQQNPAGGPALVAQRSNFQIGMTDVAWSMAVQTGALRLLGPQERQSIAYAYWSQDIYNQLLAEEMKQWTAMAAGDPDGAAAKIWKAYAQRVGVGICIASIRIERFRNPDLPPERLQQACQQYTIATPPAELYRMLGFPMPDTSWRPGADF